MLIDKNSMLWWYPLIKDLFIKQPQTIIVKDEMLGHLREDNMKALKPMMPKFIEAARSIGYPLFMRSDQFSAKHSWTKTCFVTSEDKLKGNIMELIVQHDLVDMLGLSRKALVFREFIDMDSLFTAFIGRLPISPERRYFIEKGRVICHHAYWVEASIAEHEEPFLGHKNPGKPNIPNWRKALANLNNETVEEIKLLTKYSTLVSKAISDYMSVDYCRSKHGDWYLIDMAQGERSYHPECSRAKVRL